MIGKSERPQTEMLESSQTVSSDSQGFTGIVNLQLNDLIQMVCLSRSDLSIRVRSTLGNGAIFVREGEIQHAHTETLCGEPAFFEILRWKDGQFEINLSQEVVVRSLKKPWEHLLLEAMRRRDEEAIEHNRVVLADFEESYLDRSEKGDLDEEIDQVFDELEKVSREFSEEDLKTIENVFEERTTLRVLIVDDSPFFAHQLKNMLEEEPGIEVVAYARNGKEALEFLEHQPTVDVITLDVEMPVMQGDTTLKHIMIRHPIPVITISSLQPDSLLKIFEFLQIGAVDFLPKPHAREDLSRYRERLRESVLKASKANVGHFRRWRKPKAELHPILEDFWSPVDRILAVVGAEGAHMDWFRLPLYGLCSKGILLGLQRIAEPFLPRFCQLVEDSTMTRTKPLPDSALVEPGCLYLANANRPMDFKLDPADSVLELRCRSPEELSWESGLNHWLTELAHAAGPRLSVFCLSASSSLAPELIGRLINSGARLILSPRNTVMCTELVDSIRPYEMLYPQHVIWGTPDNLLEVWLDNEPRP